MLSGRNVPQMGSTNTVGDEYKFPSCLNFNEKGDLICVGYKNKQINIFDWKHKELKYDFDSKHIEEPTNVLFINNNDNNLDVITTANDGQIRRAIISPDGKVASTRLYNKPFTCPKVVLAPESSDKILGVTSDGSLFMMDLRCTSKQQQFSLKTRISDEQGNYLPFYDVAHHPTAPEICTCSRDPFIRTFDLRNLRKCIQKMCSDIPKRRMDVHRCVYNFNGNKILANYKYESSYIFNNQNYTPSPCCYPDCSYFFGPKSEFTVSTSARNICFYYTHSPLATKNFNSCFYRAHYLTAYGSTGLRADFDKYSLKPHRSLPLIAAATEENGVVIFSPIEGNIVKN